MTCTNVGKHGFSLVCRAIPVRFGGSERRFEAERSGSLQLRVLPTRCPQPPRRVPQGSLCTRPEAVRRAHRWWRERSGDRACSNDGRSGRAYGPCRTKGCLLYTSDAADDLLCVDLGGRRIIKKKK